MLRHGLHTFALLLAATPLVSAQESRIGGHIGFLLPLVTRAAGATTNIGDNFLMGFPVGITVKGSGRMAFDLEIVPFVQGTPRNNSLTIHPGLVWDVGRRWAAGIRGAFDINSPSVGFTPLVHYSWPIEERFFKAYFIEAVLPVRFNRPTGGLATSPVTFGLHFGVGF